LLSISVKTKCMSEYRSLASHPQCGGARKLLFDEFFIFDISLLFPSPPLPLLTAGGHGRYARGGKKCFGYAPHANDTAMQSAVVRAIVLLSSSNFPEPCSSRRSSFRSPLARYEYPLNKCAAAGALFVSVVYLLLIPDKRNNGEHSRRPAVVFFPAASPTPPPSSFQGRKCTRARIDVGIKGHFVFLRFLF